MRWRADGREVVRVRREGLLASERLCLQSLESRADLGGVGICQREGEGTALVGLHGMEAAAVVRVQPDARAVVRVPHHQRTSARRDFGLVRDEVRFALSEKGRDARDLRLVHAAAAVRVDGQRDRLRYGILLLL